MKRLLAAVLVATLSFVQPVHAQPDNEQAAVAQIQGVLAEVAVWSQDFSAILTTAGQPLYEIDGFIGILDRVIAGEIRADRAVVEINAWRDRARAQVEAARLAAESLREPPSLVLLGPGGARLETALHAARDNALPTVHEFGRVIDAMAEMGLGAVRNPGKGVEARQRAVLEASIQLVRVDLARIDMNAASLSTTHPNQALMVTTQHYYASLIAIPALALAELDGGGDRAAVVAELRRHARSMRTETARATVSNDAMLAQARAANTGPVAPMLRTILAAFQTMPASIAAYNALADGVERAADAMERGEDALDVWADQEEGDRPYLEAIEQLEQQRLRILATSGPQTQ